MSRIAEAAGTDGEASRVSIDERTLLSSSSALSASGATQAAAALLWAPAAPPPSAASGHLTINLIWDSSVSSAPAGFQTAITAAAQYLDSLIADPITVNLKVGWGEENGSTTAIGNNVATGGPINGVYLSYAALKSDLTAAYANSGSATDATALSHLPQSDPTGGHTFFVGSALERAWGLISANNSEIDGAVGFNSSDTFAFDPNNRAVPGAIDLIGVAEHELTHAMGRVVYLGQQNYYSPLDLFRYSSPGVLELTPGTGAYFSIDGGATNLNNFDVSADPADWASSVVGDSFGYGYSGQVLALTQADAEELNVIGFNDAQSAGPPTVVNTTGNQEILTAPLADTIVQGGGYDVLDLRQNPIASQSSAYTLTANGDGSFAAAAGGSSDHVTGVIQLWFADKTMTMERNGSYGEYIALLYQGALGRTPDYVGLAGWTKIANGLPASAGSLGPYALSDASTIAAGFTTSTEFQSRYGSLDNSAFVTQLYANVLDRAPDTAGFNGWMSLLASGLTREHVLVGFADSNEAIANATLGFTGQSGSHPSWLFLV